MYGVGADVGGTHARALLTERGEPLAEGLAPGGNLRQVGPAQVVATLAAALTDAFHKAGLAPDLGACRVHAGVAGLATPEDGAALAATPHPFARLSAQSDAQLALDAYFGGEPGALLIVGTGCLALARDAGGQLHRRRGWGFPLEEGGGADLGLRALRLGLADWERGEESALAAALQTEFISPRAVMEWTRGQTGGGYARFAPLLFEGEDERAQKIVGEWRRSCRSLLLNLLRVSGVPALGTWGGLAQHLRWPEGEPLWQPARQSPLAWAARQSAQK